MSATPVPAMLELDRDGAATRRVPRWLSSSVWAVADQGLFAVSNLLLNVLLIRGLRPGVYGGFAVAFAMAGSVFGARRAQLLIFMSTPCSSASSPR